MGTTKKNTKGETGLLPPIKGGGWRALPPEGMGCGFFMMGQLWANRPTTGPYKWIGLLC